MALLTAAGISGVFDEPGSSPGSTSVPLAGRPGPTPTSGAASAGTPAPSKARTTPQPSTKPARTAAARPKAGTALAAVQTLRVAGRGPMTGYSRDEFGPAWTDTNRNGCDTRNDILRRDLTKLSIKSGTYGCKVLRGVLHDPYTGRRIVFVEGGASEVDIDHVVALGNAWVTGAARWPYAKQIALANDPLDLLAVDASANRQKGDGDAATWLPSNKAFRCAYVARQVSVKKKYGLYVTPAEKAAVERVLSRCPEQRLLTGGNPTRSTVLPQRPGHSKPIATPKAGSHTDPRYTTCAAAIAHGYGPYYRGRDPEYAWYEDRDNDGVVCES